ncbi:MAG: glycosyltransferase [Pseudomonadota bacterium]
MSAIVFLSCHLSGTGHLVRTLALARAARKRGHDVTVISGGRPLEHVDVSGLDIVQLPPLTVRDLDFSTLRKADGREADADYMEGRKTVLKNAVRALRPDALVTELFPLGRRALAAEFLLAIETAHASGSGQPVRVVCSVRDAPEPKPHRIAETASVLARSYDAVLVHGDADFLPLSETWPLKGPGLPPVRHTGYVVGPMPLALAHNPGVLVSAGGGTLGQRLLEVAADASRLSSRPWHLLVGGPDAGARAQALLASHGHDNLTVEPVRRDYRALMASADCSISLCGYNTAVELAQCQTPAVLVPSEEGGEHEQLIRARRLATYPGISLLRDAMLDPAILAETADQAAAAPRRAPIPLQCDDGDAAIARIEELLTPQHAPQ